MLNTIKKTIIFPLIIGSFGTWNLCLGTWNLELSTCSAQQRCGTMDYLEQQKQLHPELEGKMAQMEAQMQEYLKNPPPAVQAVVTIPVVVHILYNTSSQNVSDARVNEQIDVLNKDFRRLNTDWTKVTQGNWASLVADCGVEFCLAAKDPSGNPTTGIIHKQTSVTSFSANDAMKSSSQGGDDAWNAAKYLNIWVCNISGGILGYATFPGNPASTDGVVVQYNVFGKTGTWTGYNLGRTTTHEVGHYLGLYHIWGDESACSGSDQVSDTPNQASEHGSCYTAGSVQTDACTSTSPGVMWMNYMDYTPDACTYMFTNGQKTRTAAALNGLRSGLLTSAVTNCTIAAIDAGIPSIATPNGTTCSITFSPVVTLKNYGANTLTSCTINYKIDNNANQTYNWTGSLATWQQSNVTLPALTSTAGTHTFTCFTSNPNSSADGNAGNNQSVSVFNIITTAQTLPFTEGVENMTFPPSGWTLNNPDGATTWARTTSAKKTGMASMFMDNFDYNANGQADELITPPLNLQFFGNPSLTFQVAYQMYTDPNASPPFSDTLKVQISTDCGTTWNTLYNKYSTQLTTATPAFSETEFVPNANQWRLETISLAAYTSAANALIKFRHITDFENNLYVDDINITGAGNPGVNEMNLAQFVTVYPNPSSGMFNVRCAIYDVRFNSMEVYNVMGEKVTRSVIPNGVILPAGQAGNLTIDISSQPDGIYFIHLKTETGSIVKKLIISR